MDKRSVSWRSAHASSQQHHHNSSRPVAQDHGGYQLGSLQRGKKLLRSWRGWTDSQVQVSSWVRNNPVLGEFWGPRTSVIGIYSHLGQSSVHAGNLILLVDYSCVTILKSIHCTSQSSSFIAVVSSPVSNSFSSSSTYWTRLARNSIMQFNLKYTFMSNLLKIIWAVFHEYMTIMRELTRHGAQEMTVLVWGVWDDWSKNTNLTTGKKRGLKLGWVLFDLISNK